MSQRIEVGGALSITHPKSLLSGSLKARIVVLVLRAQNIATLEARIRHVNGETDIIGNDSVLGVIVIFLAVIPIFMATGA